MSLRTVVVCPDCHRSFIVNGIPERTGCRSCPSVHKFKSLKKYYQTEDAEAARRARTKVQAEVDGNSELYDRAAESGALEETVDGIIEDDDYLSQMGADIDEVNEAEKRASEPEHQSKSQKEIVFEAVETQDSPDRDDIAAYAEQFGLNREKALEQLDKFREKGDIGGLHQGPFQLH